ncbi:hypothetical protein RhiirA4_481196 [Rhizophagus irregularis]|uniref:Uncharacterized protein n=1 Tax=Rhizophagus irregularis TaxID=588596 RepID=A0A2I1HJ33_9GLOM|nr:hypothetical protein RhiirA4_481196 [Rhizophagus irregularis]
MKIKRFKYSPKRNNLPLNIRQMYNQIYQLNSHIALLKERLCLFQTTNNNNLKGNNNLNTLDLIITFNHHWDRKKMWIIKLLNEQTIQFDHTNFNQIISNIDQVDYAIYTIKNLIQHIKAKLSKEKSAWDLNQIQHYIERRNDDLKSNQKRMLTPFSKKTRGKLH